MIDLIIPTIGLIIIYKIIKPILGFFLKGRKYNKINKLTKLKYPKSNLIIEKWK